MNKLVLVFAMTLGATGAARADILCGTNEMKRSIVLEGENLGRVSVMVDGNPNSADPEADTKIGAFTYSVTLNMYDALGLNKAHGAGRQVWLSYDIGKSLLAAGSSSASAVIVVNAGAGACAISTDELAYEAPRAPGTVEDPTHRERGFPAGCKFVSGSTLTLSALAVANASVSASGSAHYASAGIEIEHQPYLHYCDKY